MNCFDSFLSLRRAQYTSIPDEPLGKKNSHMAQIYLDPRISEEKFRYVSLGKKSTVKNLKECLSKNFDVELSKLIISVSLGEGVSEELHDDEALICPHDALHCKKFFWASLKAEKMLSE